MIYVVGTGRSGTSTVARVLHESLGICFGHRFDEPNEFNPKGFYEDLDVRENLVDGLIQGKISPQAFKMGVDRIHRKNKCSDKPIGFKHPLLSYLDRATWVGLDPELVIWCVREEEKCVQSMVKYRNYRTIGQVDQDWATWHATHTYTVRYRKLENSLKGLDFVKVLDFNEFRSDVWILSSLGLTIG
jgi:hypothetical protein